jgi:hypothetical protein
MNPRRQPTPLQRFLSLSPAPIDDRGQLIRPREGEVLGALRGRTQVRRWTVVEIVVYTLVATVGGYFAITSLAAQGRTTGGLLPLLPIALIFAVVGLTYVIRTLFKKATRQPGNAAVSATSAAMGHCGSCGYDMNALSPAPGGDGCVPCPECGAAWHIERRTYAGLDREALAALVRQIPHLKSRRNSVGLLDDRGVRLMRGFAWPAPLWSSGWPPTAEAALVRFKAARRTYRLKILGGVAAVWLVIVISMALSGASTESLLQAVIMCGVVLLTLGFIISFVGLPARTVRTEALLAERCPQCSAVLDPALVCFDRCTACRGCGAAWDTAAIGMVGPHRGTDARA